MLSIKFSLKAVQSFLKKVDWPKYTCLFGYFIFLSCFLNIGVNPEVACVGAPDVVVVPDVVDVADGSDSPEATKSNKKYYIAAGIVVLLATAGCVWYFYFSPGALAAAAAAAADAAGGAADGIDNAAGAAVDVVGNAADGIDNAAGAAVDVVGNAAVGAAGPGISVKAFGEGASLTWVPSAQSVSRGIDVAPHRLDLQCPWCFGNWEFMAKIQPQVLPDGGFSVCRPCMKIWKLCPTPGPSDLVEAAAALDAVNAAGGFLG